VRRIAIQGQPPRRWRIPAAHAPQELPDVPAPFARDEGPMDAAAVHRGEQEQVEPAARLLVALQDRAAGPGVTSAPIRLDREGLDVEGRPDGPAGAVSPPRAQAVQDHPPIGIVAEELAPDAPQGVPPFLSTRRRCSRLIASTIRRRMR
jgi:hypothetical protein